MKTNLSNALIQNDQKRSRPADQRSRPVGAAASIFSNENESLGTRFVLLTDKTVGLRVSLTLLCVLLICIFAGPTNRLAFASEQKPNHEGEDLHTAAAPTQAEHEIEYDLAGGFYQFRPDRLNVELGDTIRFHNRSNSPLTLEIGRPPDGPGGGPGGEMLLFMPIIMSSTSQTQRTAAAQAVRSGLLAQEEPGIVTIVILPQEDYLYTLEKDGETKPILFFNGDNPQQFGVLNVLDDAEPPNPEEDPDLFGVGYATSAELTLIRWFWNSPNQPPFVLTRMQDGQESNLGRDRADFDSR